MTACSSMRLFVVAGSPPDSSTCLAIAPAASRATRIAAQPPGPGLPEQAPSVQSSRLHRGARVGAAPDGTRDVCGERHTGTQQATMEGRPSRWWYALLALPLLGLLYPPLYATRDPELAGIPFFYWYQFAWVVVAALITLVVYLKTAAMTLALISEPHDTNTTALAVFIVLFALVTVLGFVAARWRRAELDHLDEWGLGGRKFGTVITWFLLGGDLYTAYTFIAVPALVFGAGAIGFFALPYTIMVYPLIFVVMPRLWTVCRANGYVTPADFVRGRYGSRHLGLVMALTGILATMPYIALQLVGMQIVLGALGVDGDWPLIIAFVILAAYTYQSGLRAPALIAVVKDTLIYVTILVAVIYIPSKIGGFGAMFDAADKALPTARPAGLADPEGRRRAGRLRDARVRLGARAVSLPARDHRRARREVRADGAPQHRAAAGLHVPARPHRAARLHGDRARDRPEQPELRRPRPVPQRLPVVVRRASRSRRSRSARSCRRRSCRSPRRTSSRARSTRPTCARRRRTPTRRARRRSSRCS